MIKLIAFDWNGTIFADTYAILDSINEVLKFLQLKPVSLKTFQQHFDVPVTKTYLGLGIPEEVVKSKALEIAKVFHSNYEIRAATVRTRAFVRQLLRCLSENKISAIIFSNHINEPIKRQLKRLKIEKYFSAVLANIALDVALKERSKQEKLRNYLKENNFSVSEVLVIGDTIEEIEIGNELGLITIALTHGNCSTTRLKAAKPDYLIGSLKETIGIIREVNHAAN